MKRFIYSPVGLVQQVHIPVQSGSAEIVLRLFRHINTYHPPLILLNFFVPFFIIIFIATMEVEHVFGDQDKFKDPLEHEPVSHFPFQVHDIVFDGIVPFPDKFYDHIFFFIISQNNLQVQGVRTEIIPLWMDQVIIDASVNSNSE